MRTRDRLYTAVMGVPMATNEAGPRKDTVHDGDKVRVTYVGTVVVESQMETNGFFIRGDGRQRWVDPGNPMVTSVEVLEEAVHLFKPGTEVRFKTEPHTRFLVGHGGALNLASYKWEPATDYWFQFYMNSKYYEEVR